MFSRAEENRVLEVVGLTDTGAKLTGAFSTGMRQRLLLARALIGTPRVLLLDEPTRGLDPVSAREFRRFLRETVVAQQGCTVLLATHDADEVWELCDHVGVLDRGRLLATGATAELRQRVVGLRYRALVASSAPEAAIARARGAGFVLAARSAAGEVGWESLEFEVPSGLASAGQLLALLTVDGTQVASFEPVRASLAELIERVIHAQRPVADA